LWRVSFVRISGTKSWDVRICHCVCKGCPSHSNVLNCKSGR
jgi:hypothetical protein